jgi:membrane associated rhomboid family serine protease
MIWHKKGMSVTLKLLILNFLFFMVMLVVLFRNPNASSFVALVPSQIIAGKQLWTIVTNMFMHADVSHLLMNMLSLVFLGSFLERVIGRRRFLVFYLSAGIFAGLFFVLFSYLFNADLNVGAVGASGAIFGIAGVLAVLTPKLPVYIMFIPIAMPMWFAVILILSLLWLLSSVAGLPIGNTAHLGGLIAGLLYGFYLRKKYRRKIYLLNRFLARQ